MATGAARTALANQWDATYWGFGVVQILKDYATELFATFSIADLDDVTVDVDFSDFGGPSAVPVNIEFETITTGLVGARLKF